jgi:hypothetical protein
MPGASPGREYVSGKIETDLPMEVVHTLATNRLKAEDLLPAAEYRNPSEPHYVFIKSPMGTGKSHATRALVNQVRDKSLSNIPQLIPQGKKSLGGDEVDAKGDAEDIVEEEGAGRDVASKRKAETEAERVKGRGKKKVGWQQTSMDKFMKK